MIRPVSGVSPADTSIAAGIEEDRKGQFEELKSTLQVMRLVDKNSSKADTVTLMILLERGELQLDPTAQMTSPAIRDLQLMFGVMCRVAPKLQDAYWLARNFYNHMIALQIDAKELISQTRILLEKDEPALFERIMSSTLTGRCSNSGGGKNQQGPTGSMVLLPIERWFNTLFASVLPDAALLKVWDKFIGGLVNKHLATTAKLIIVALKPLLMPATVTQKLRQHHHLHHYPTPSQTQNLGSSGTTVSSSSHPSQQHQQQQQQFCPQEQLQHPPQAPQQHGQHFTHSTAPAQRQPLQNNNINMNHHHHPQQQQHPHPAQHQYHHHHHCAGGGSSNNNSQNQNPNSGTSPTTQQLQQQQQQHQTACQNLSTSSKQQPGDFQSLLQEQNQFAHQPQQPQHQQQQLNFPPCCAEAASGGNLGQPEVGNLPANLTGVGCVSGTAASSIDNGDLLQQSQLMTIFNQPLSDDMAAPLIAIL
ncbi:uncharacterized protein LOC111248804 isoform X2 [Varroa destructor]|uniref:Uncharacterized protein n=1 Tax=Varroa destructor TaxID=109461 RepID=A0A7M7JXL5_VARDE|nr:uncharacterized protein LOC111248804 isoform X2 [Varroa destructor]